MEEHEHWWRAKKAKMEQERKEQSERNVRNRVWIEETERKRVRDKLTVTEGNENWLVTVHYSRCTCMGCVNMV